MKRYTIQETADQLGVCKQRISRKLQQRHFPNAGICECGRSIMIPKEDIDKNKILRSKWKLR